ncbi:GNAT family N-acetyltransferase [Peribacillus castrilensis]|jgi:RimJ/RimL family protein N-acetyltransferase|uniref:Acetyltransferase n=1 Tax=Peribacillus simplex TaxID=1478 RepID=A0AAN2TTI5_9BACI|nr:MULTISPECIES: GNAT family N-acetyltransferase [Bacillaceae]MCP1093980.1 GNAT family N-acetyltransferase [Bacillaceae bacterium OS4b]QYF80289.1 GNAT family N-acetyltransferase [Brevibacterium sp. PAMC21349]MBD8590748.1 GNAT family N-acetyltransferase [Peribacillus simplex]MCF7623038.1 GNAT family N-acetyltransferase [Peribacillus frigoritolerans]MCP1153595.1 GNAT family N-acetyltransferase [Peribacillus frigoritolerans]
MLKKRDFTDCFSLYEQMTHPDVFPFVRHKVDSYEEYVFITKQTIEAEDAGQLISRTILDEWENPIGCISLYDIENGAGFLGTWLGKPYHGKGYNAIAKDAFFKELFFELGLETVFMRIRKKNIRSIKAAEKLPYAVNANETRKSLYDQINHEADIYDLYEIPKDLYNFHILRQHDDDEQQLLEA